MLKLHSLSLDTRIILLNFLVVSVVNVMKFFVALYWNFTFNFYIWHNGNTKHTSLHGTYPQ